MKTNYQVSSLGNTNLSFLLQKESVITHSDCMDLCLWTFEDEDQKLSFLLKKDSDCLIELIENAPAIIENLLEKGIEQRVYQIQETIKEGLLYRVVGDLYLKKEEFDIGMFVYTLCCAKTSPWKMKKPLMKAISLK
ncbi:hypothetical protein [Sediminitomix flava]|uniref:Uncharacterized protein n=1 Tax=Sediminitomix flava TaxID=379075 RepID=A0A315Z0E9_SEDFL|nr:hypothetical protein [Sediminitomix flava]PWJ36113.1 hypothetical protein BC781_109129 [Sediminitomix flava]